MMKIHLWVAQNPYGTVTSFAKSLQLAFERLGAECNLFDAQPELVYKAVSAMFHESPDLICSFSSVQMQYDHLADLISIPHLSWLVDRIFYFPELVYSKKSYLGLIDNQDIHYLSDSLKERSFFLPHAVDRELLDIESDERPLDLVFCGTYRDPIQLKSRWQDKFGRLKPRFEEVCNAFLAEDSNSLFTLLKQAFAEQSHATFCALFTEAERYVSAVERIELLQRLDGNNLHVFGLGDWSSALHQAMIHPPLDFSSLPALFRRSKIVINSTPSFHEALHERILYAMASGALVLTGHNSNALDTHFGAEHALMTYKRTELDALGEQLQQLLEAPKRWQRQVESAQEVVRAHHTFDCRAAEILKFFRLHS